MKKWTYREAGVDLQKIKRAHRTAADFFSSTLALRKGFGSVYKGAGHYAGLLRIDSKKLLAIHTDGVGSKVLVAQKMRSSFLVCLFKRRNTKRGIAKTALESRKPIASPKSTALGTTFLRSAHASAPRARQRDQR